MKVMITGGTGFIGYHTTRALLDAGAKGHPLETLRSTLDVEDPHAALVELANRDQHWKMALLFPEDAAPADHRDGHYRVRWVKMGFVDSLFESQSGFSTTGATVISDLEDPHLSQTVDCVELRLGLQIMF